MIISWRVIRMDQMLGRINQIMTTPVKRKGRSSIPALTLWVSPLSIYTMLLNIAEFQLQKINWIEQFEVLINLLALNLLMLFLNLNQRHQSLIVCTIWWKRSWLPLRTLKRYRFCTRFMIPSILCWTFNVSEYLVRTARELKKVKGILAKPAQKQGKVISQNTIDLVLSMYEDDEFSRQMPGKKDCLHCKGSS